MTHLAAWMKSAKLTDAALAAKVKNKPSRSQISRIRRGLCGTSKANADKLAKITGLPWHAFIVGGA